MFEWLIIAVIICTAVHFIYEGILLPSFRQDIRYRLFALRDDLRGLMADESAGLDPEKFKHLQSFLNTTLRFLHRVDIRAVFYANRKYDQDGALASRIRKREAEIDAYQHEGFQAIRKQGFLLFGLAFMLNSLGFIVMVSPIFLVLSICRHVRRIVAYISNGLRRIACTPESESRHYDDNILSPA